MKAERVIIIGYIYVPVTTLNPKIVTDSQFCKHGVFVEHLISLSRWFPLLTKVFCCFDLVQISKFKFYRLTRFI